MVVSIAKIPNSEVVKIHRYTSWEDYILTEQWSFLCSTCLCWHHACLAGVAEANPIIQTTQILLSITILVFELWTSTLSHLVGITNQEPLSGYIFLHKWRASPLERTELLSKCESTILRCCVNFVSFQSEGVTVSSMLLKMWTLGQVQISFLSTHVLCVLFPSNYNHHFKLNLLSENTAVSEVIKFCHRANCMEAMGSIFHYTY